MTTNDELTPLAWMYDGPDGQHYIHEHRDAAHHQLLGWGWEETPLYAKNPAIEAVIERLKTRLEVVDGWAEPWTEAARKTQTAAAIRAHEAMKENDDAN
ncbi:MAG: hypothetical protein KGM49_00740 [Sphingomonadales bacterium]|nr:hypothetical protein [Sphingomonadales bacterium]